MSTRIYQLFLSLSLGIGLSSCSKFLKEAPASNELRISTADDFQDLIIGSAMEFTTVNTQPFSTLELYADDLDENPNYTVVSSLTSRGYHFTWQPDMWVYGNVGNDGYSFPYDRIKGCNAVLDGIDNAIKTSPKQVDMIKAQALTLRAFYYFRMVNMYGKPYNYDKSSLGVTLKLTANLIENGIKRNTVEEIYDQIVKDLLRAIDLFKPYEIVRGNYQCNLPSAYILLSRVYLHMEEYEKCIAAASEAMKVSGDLTDFTKLTSYTLYSYNNSETVWLYGSSPVFYGADAQSSSAGAFIPSSSLLGLYSSQDKRLSFWFNTARTNNIKSTTSMTTPSSSIRMAEAYLNRMEAYTLTRKYQEAMDDLNKLRRNRITSYANESISDPAELLAAIRTERRKEMCYEQHRWFDLRRYGMPAIQHKFRINLTDPWQTFTLKEKDPLYTLPIPDLYFKNNNQLDQNESRNVPTRQGN